MTLDEVYAAVERIRGMAGDDEAAHSAEDNLRERLTGWQGPPGAAHNAVSEFLEECGLLNNDWSLTPARGMPHLAILWLPAIFISSYLVAGEMISFLVAAWPYLLATLVLIVGFFLLASKVSQ